MHDADALLCENCGYVLRGLDPSGVCPECAAPIARSLPERRTGTPWQRKKSVGALARTMWMALWTPRRMWDVVRVTPALESFGQAAAALFVTAVVWGASIGCMITTMGMLSDGRPSGFLSLFILYYSICATVLAWFALIALVFVECVGIRLFGRRRGWRTSPDVAWAVVAHASVGWLVGAVVFLIATLGWSFVSIVELYVLHDVLTPALMLWLLVAVLHPFIGLVWFETLVYIGWRRMRFANKSGAE